MRHLISKINGARKTKCIGAPVALDHDAVESQERTAVGAARIHLLLQDPKTAGGEHRPNLRDPGPLHGLPEIFADLARGAFSCLQRDVASEALNHDHIDNALSNLITLDEADVVEREVGVFQPCMSLAHFVSTLDVLDADVK